MCVVCSYFFIIAEVKFQKAFSFLKQLLEDILCSEVISSRYGH